MKGEDFLESMDFEKVMEDELVRSEHERLVSEAVAEARREWEADMSARIIAAREEGERIAGMSAEERLMERERKLAQREKEMLGRELRARMELKLIERRLPKELAEALSYENEEKCLRSLDVVEAAFRDAVQTGVTERLGGMETPKSGRMAEPMNMTDEQYYAMRMGAGAN